MSTTSVTTSGTAGAVGHSDAATRPSSRTGRRPVRNGRAESVRPASVRAESGPALAPRVRRETLRPAGRAVQPTPTLLRERRVPAPGVLRPVDQPSRTTTVRTARPLFAPDPTRVPRVAPEPAYRPSTLRLTRRGRGVLALAGLAAVAVTCLVGGVGLPSEPTIGGATQVHVVQPGETLWGIARTAGLDAPTRLVVDRIEEINGLDTALLVPGQELQVPAAA